jgi:hypothetical protein
MIFNLHCVRFTPMAVENSLKETGFRNWIT